MFKRLSEGSRLLATASRPALVLLLLTSAQSASAQSPDVYWFTCAKFLQKNERSPSEALAFSQGLYIGLTTGQPVVLSPVLGGLALHSSLIKYCTHNNDYSLQAAAEELRRSSEFLGPP